MQKALRSFSKSSLRLLIGGVIFFSQGALSDVRAQGNLLITPKRIVFDGQKPSQEVNLANIGKDTARYAVSFIQIRMKEDGGFEQITQPDPGQRFADKHLRIFPRTVTLGPNEAQVVKIQVSQPGKLLPGEYRSHLYFRAVPEKTLGEKSTGADSAGLSVRLTPVFGISIPVIIRVGELTSRVSLSRLKLETSSEATPVLSARINRSGNISVYGDITIEHISKEGNLTQVASVKGVSVYTPNEFRDVKIKLDSKAGINYRSGKLRVTYSAPKEEKSQKPATEELLLN